MKKDNSLKINIGQKEETFWELLPKAFALFVFVFGFSAMFFDGFGLKNGLFFAFVSGMTAAFCVLINKKNLSLFVSAVSFGLLFLLPVARNGIFLLANEIVDFLVLKTGRIFLPFDTAENADGRIALLFVAAGVSVFASAVISRENPGYGLPICLLSTAGLLSGFLSTGIYFCVFTAGIFCLFFNEKLFRKKNIAVFSTAATCLILCFVLTGTLPSGAGEKIKLFSEDFAHKLIYDSKTNAMPEGKLKNLGAFNKNGAQAIEIAMEKPQKLYLKGFVGEVYTGNGWKSLGNEALSEYAKDFYVLHENGFYGQSAVATALEATEQQGKSVMSIRNISACSKRAYLPYAVSDAPFDERKIGDITKSFGGEYEISYISGGLLEWYSAQVELSEKQGNSSETNEHLKNEYIYREFVRDSFLDVPEGAFEALERAFAEEDASTATEIISAVLIYLEKNVAYDEDVITRNGSEDFTAFFLEKTARGYSVHYATAATLMLRYFGIPARYVEGYFLSAEDAAKYENGEKIVLTEENAHAWTEYYLEGVGWIPFETTPGYMDDELEKAAFSTNGESSKRYEQSELPETNVEQERPKSDITEAKQKHALLIAIAVSVPLILLIAAVCYVFAMRRKLKKAILTIDSADNKTAVPLRFGYAQKLLDNSGLETEGYEEAFTINKEALFSEHEISDEQRRMVDDFAEKVLAECKKSWSLWQKIKYKWIKFIY